MAVAGSDRSKVYVVKTEDHGAGVRALVERCEIGSLAGKSVAVKANYNSADPFPASTHPDTLSAIIDALAGRKASYVTMAERSGMGYTPDVLAATGVKDLASGKAFNLHALDHLDESMYWLKQGRDGFHWKRGYLFSRIFSEADVIVQTCCLKAHRFGGHFTMSLKNSVGMVARYDPETDYDYMRELHGSRQQRQMIAEINTSYAPAAVIMDAIKGFSIGGPEAGTLISPGVMLASADRVALDACGVAIMRMSGTTPEVSRGSIFEQEQIARAAQLGLGAAGPDELEVVPLNDGARDVCRRIDRELRGKMVARL
jgi:uncharacterized protein (DUF362 family)